MVPKTAGSWSTSIGGAEGGITIPRMIEWFGDRTPCHSRDRLPPPYHAAQARPIVLIVSRSVSVDWGEVEMFVVSVIINELQRHE